MFSGCSSLGRIYAGDWWFAEIASGAGMFSGCTSLVGQNGTAFDPQVTDSAYAHVDSEGDPGYLWSGEGLVPISGAEIAPIPDQEYTGSAVEPGVSLVLDGDELECGADYEVAYIGNVDAGTATTVVMGRGGYRGSASATFRIAPVRVSPL